MSAAAVAGAVGAVCGLYLYEDEDSKSKKQKIEEKIEEEKNEKEIEYKKINDRFFRLATLDIKRKRIKYAANKRYAKKDLSTN